MANLENQLCETMEYIVDNAVQNASFDKTIQATILKTIDKTIGKYSVKYQDSIFYAYAADINVTYPDNTEVYILIPGNEMSNEKTILGSVKKLGSNYINIPEGDEAFEIIGANCIKGSKEYGLCSYNEGYWVKTVYDRAGGINEIELNIQDVAAYIKNTSSIICGAEFYTKLPVEQQLRGNYGIIFELEFLDNSEENLITKHFIVDVNQMRGNPYRIPYYTRQYGIFNIDGKNFKSVKKIMLFVYDFPNKSEDKPDDIFIRNLELSAAERLSEEELASSALTFITPKGTFFTHSSSDSDTLSIQAQVRVKGKVVDKDSQQLKYYWFIEDATITSKSKEYNNYGKQGWRCLNKYNEISPETEEHTAVVEWLPEDYELIIRKNEIVAKEVKYKCVILYGETILSKEITITNYASEYEISIESDEGTQFYYDIGYPTLTCKINGVEKVQEGFKYVWVSIDNNGVYENLIETPEHNTLYNDTLKNYQKLLSEIENGTKLKEANKDILEGYEDILKNYEKITRVETNKIHNFAINKITVFNTFKCSVYYNDTFLGTASIVLLNTLDSENVYTLIINNGQQVFKYNEEGISPSSQSLENPLLISPLSFTLYDNLGKPFSEELLKKCKIQWKIPTENTLLKLSDDYKEDEIKDGIAIFNQLLAISYNIENRYDINKNNNNIELIVDYKDLHLVANTNFTFIKEGESGTNGTNFVCRIIPNNIKEETTPNQVMITNGELNYTPVEKEKWFKVQLWENGENIFTLVESDPNQDIQIKWSVLKNNYGLNITEDSSIKIIDEKLGKFEYLGFKADKDNHPANIVKCEVKYKGILYYATLPIITVDCEEDFSLQLKENSGFQSVLYTTDGRKPQYNTSWPFELKVYEKIDAYNEDISNIQNEHKVNYTHILMGKEYRDGGWYLTEALILENNNKLELKDNQLILRPINEYNGLSVTNGLLWEVSQNGSLVGKIHIPIHFLLNKYGKAALNDWDGNHIEINNEGGFILAPQIGAGQKDEDNSFTGMFMGTVKEAGKNNTEIGLFGYGAGVRTMFLNSEDGSAIFGRNDGGQIIIDPTNLDDKGRGKAMLYSHNFWKNYDSTGKPSSYLSGNENNEGLLIDLTTPCIRYGKGNFSVDADGNLTANNANITGIITATEGAVGDWIIKDGELKNSTGSIVINPTTGIKVGEGFSVDPNGNIQLTGSISWGDNDVGGGVSQIYALYARSKLSTPTKSYNSYPSTSTTGWHRILDENNDFYVSYSYDDGETWSAALKLQGEDGAPGEPGDTDWPSYIKSTHITGAYIASPYVCGGKIYATGNGKKDEAAFYIYDSGSISSSGTLKLGNKMGYISYDTDGSGSNEAAERIIFEALDDNALKIQTNNGNISIAAGGTGNYVYFGSKTSFGGAIIVTTDKYVTSTSNLGSGTLGQIKFVIES